VDVDLALDGNPSVSTCEIIPFTLRIGAATVRMDGIGGVGTLDEYRRRGYARRVLEAAIDRMAAGDAALTMLYGIADFYPQFGYATAGPDYFIVLQPLHEELSAPAGWLIRPAQATDLPALQRLYERTTAHATGPAIRALGNYPWTHLVAPAETEEAVDCLLALRPGGEPAAYIWRGANFWPVTHFEADHPEALMIAEVMADGPQAADLALLLCRSWADREARQRGRPVERVVLSLPPEGPLAAAAMHQATLFQQSYSPCGGSMVRVLHVGRLLAALQPELERRWLAAGHSFVGTLRILTDLGAATLALSPQGVTATDTRSGPQLVVRLPQTALGRLALGAFAPDDLLDRLAEPPDDPARELLQALFPQRLPFMYAPDRY
jgi:hypothetical protein